MLQELQVLKVEWIIHQKQWLELEKGELGKVNEDKCQR